MTIIAYIDNAITNTIDEYFIKLINLAKMNGK